MPIFNPYALATKLNSTLSTVDEVESTFDKVEGASTQPIRPTRAFRDAYHDFPVVRQKTRRERQDAALSTLGGYRSTARTQTAEIVMVSVSTLKNT